MSDFLRGVSPEPSATISAATNGLYDSLVVGIYSNGPNLDSLFFRDTLVASLTNMGWSRYNPKQGVLIRFIGNQTTVNRMSSLIQDIPFIKSSGFIHHQPFSAEYYQEIEYELKHLTHLLLFHNQQEPVNTTVSDMAKNYCVGVLNVISNW